MRTSSRAGATSSRQGHSPRFASVCSAAAPHHRAASPSNRRTRKIATHRPSIRASDPRRRRSRSRGCVDRPIDRRLLARVHLEGLVDHGPGTKDNGKVVVASTGQWLSR
jgi:hypothetical protein